MKLREYMDHHKITYRTMAQRLGVDAAQVHRWCTGVRLPSLLQVAAITQVTGGQVTAADFVDQPAPTPSEAA